MALGFRGLECLNGVSGDIILGPFCPKTSAVEWMGSLLLCLMPVNISCIVGRHDESNCTVRYEVMECKAPFCQRKECPIFNRRPAMASSRRGSSVYLPHTTLGEQELYGKSSDVRIWASTCSSFISRDLKLKAISTLEA